MSAPQVKAIPIASIPCFQSIEGVLAEAYFEKLAQNKGWIVVHSTPAQDRLGWDFLIDKDEQSLKVDVKCMKKIRRKDVLSQDKYFWIELAKSEGNPGWLYKSQADVIAFETSGDFIIIKKQDLIELVDRTIDKSVIVSSQAEAVNKVYQRKKLHGPGLEDLTLIESKRVRERALECWDKTELMKTGNQLECDHITSSENSLHQEAIHAITFRSARLREQREAEIEQSIEIFKFCPRCGSKFC